MHPLHFSKSWRQDPETKFFKNKVEFVDYRMKLVVLTYSESYLEETKYILPIFLQSRILLNE